MALSRQSLSPTANLLRNSRLFSLPNPLPRPPVSESFGAGITKASDTATLPYPTHHAITTTQSSLARGDWGLKRPLPSRSHLVQTSDPVLRVTQLDTIEHVTDFDSAADHVRTRQKWEEMGVPMIKGLAQMKDQDLTNRDTPLAGAFEVRDDTTSYDTEMGLDEAGLYLKALKKSMPGAEREKAAREMFNATWDEKWKAKKAAWRTLDLEAFEREARAFNAERIAAKKALSRQLSNTSSTDSTPFTPFTPPGVDPLVHNTRRWKHDGPWLPGMGANDFVAYLTKQISGQKKEFNTYLREYVKNEIYTTRRLAASTSGKTPLDMAEAEMWREQHEKTWRDIPNAEVAKGIKALRKETARDPLASKLVSKLILPFLKLPAIKFKSTAFRQDAKGDADKFAFDPETAPLSTHPSAGLGYLRTKAYIANHPILGPQSKPAPVPSRVIQARTTGTAREPFARLGVAGFVANDQYRSTDAVGPSYGAFSNAKDVETIDVDTVGGRKILVQPQFGSVTNNGRILIKLLRSTGAEVQVARGELDDRPPVRENYDSDPMGNLVGGMGKSGVRELDELSGQAQQFTSYLESMKKARPPPGMPGMADALRE
jgi:hypothetical protein